MFSAALAKVRQFTRPFIVSTRLFDGTIESGLCAYVLLNDQGWIATASHVFQTFQKHQNDAPHVASYRDQETAIQSDSNLTKKQKLKRIRSLRSDTKWVTDYSFLWGPNGERVNQIFVLNGIDLCIGQLAPFEPQPNAIYPTIKNPIGMTLGTSLCRLGYPFHNVDARFDTATGEFNFPPAGVQIHEFPNEGIFTRVHVLPQSPDSTTPLELIETSSPGFRGQSGGPIFDTAGDIWAIQSDTLHLPLGFSPKIVINGKSVVEHQFLNVGRGVHAKSLIGLLSQHQVAHGVSAN
jgi:hypothetical protein